ncbi:MAG: hypothetical protein NVS3B5_11620 [Sphingomicrobium sp.]
MTEHNEEASEVCNGVHCMVVAGTHAGKVGIVHDRNISKSGHATITVVQEGGNRFKTLARNVVPTHNQL